MPRERSRKSGSAGACCFGECMSLLTRSIFPFGRNHIEFYPHPPKLCHEVFWRRAISAETSDTIAREDEISRQNQGLKERLMLLDRERSEIGDELRGLERKHAEIAASRSANPSTRVTMQSPPKKRSRYSGHFSKAERRYFRAERWFPGAISRNSVGRPLGSNTATPHQREVLAVGALLFFGGRWLIARGDRRL